MAMALSPIFRESAGFRGDVMKLQHQQPQGMRWYAPRGEAKFLGASSAADSKRLELTKTAPEFMGRVSL
jgi:hypothetical protein